MPALQVGWFLRKLMTSTTVDTEYKLNEDKSTFTKVFGALHINNTMHSIYLFCQVTSNMARSTEYPMPTQGEFFPKRSLSGKEEVCCSNQFWSLSLVSRWEGLWRQVGEALCKK